MDRIALFNLAHLDGIGRMMDGDCLKASVNMVPPPSSDGDGSFKFGIPHGGG